MLASIFPKLAGLEAEGEIVAPYRVRPSGVTILHDGEIYGRCPRAGVYHRLNVPAAPMPGRFALVLDDSSWHESLTADWIQKSAYRLHSEQMGIDCLKVPEITLPAWHCAVCHKFRCPKISDPLPPIQECTRCLYPGDLLHGHIDGVIENLSGHEYEYEHKAINHFTFTRHWELKEKDLPVNYICQPAIYTIGLNRLGVDIKEILLVIKNKMTSQYLDYLIEYDIENDVALIKEMEHSGYGRRTLDFEVKGLVSSAVFHWQQNERFYKQSMEMNKPVLPLRPFDQDSWQCRYCLDPKTPVLAADFSWKTIDSIKTGDQIWGFDEFPSGKFRRSRLVSVLNRFNRRAETLKLTTDRGDVVCSTDHRWLVYTGGKSIAAGRRHPRPSHMFRSGIQTFWVETCELRPGWRLFFFGEPRNCPDDPEYKIGYIQGLIAGDGTINVNYWRFVRVALKDLEPLDRLQRYLADFCIDSLRGPFVNQSKTPMEKVTVVNRDPMNNLLDLLDIRSTTESYAAGFLAGLFDAEGSLIKNGSPRISNTNRSLLQRAVDAGRILNLNFAIEPWENKESGVGSARLYSTNMTRDIFRFFSLCRPAIQRKVIRASGRRMQGKDSWATVLSLENLGTRNLVDLETSSRTFIAAGFPSHNCQWFQGCWENYEEDFAKLEVNADLGDMDFMGICRDEVQLQREESAVKKTRTERRNTIRKILKEMEVKSGRSGDYVIDLSLTKRHAIEDLEALYGEVLELLGKNAKLRKKFEAIWKSNWRTRFVEQLRVREKKEEERK